jgi:hypothetical protein
MRRQAFVALATAGLVKTNAAPGRRLGGSIFLKSDDPVALAREHRRLGYSTAYCPALSVGQPEKIAAVRQAFANQNDEAQPVRAKFTIEMMGWMPPDGPDAYLRLKDAGAPGRSGPGPHPHLPDTPGAESRSPRPASRRIGLRPASAPAFLPGDCYLWLPRWIRSV